MDENKIATLVAQQVSADTNKQVDQAVRIGQAVRQKQNVAGSL